MKIILMTEPLIKMKHWQLFLLIYGFPLLLFITSSLISYSLYASLIYFLTIVLLWFLSVEIMNNEVKNYYRLIMRYIYLVLYPVIYIIILYPLTSIDASHPLFYYLLPFQLGWIILYIHTLIRITRSIIQNTIIKAKPSYIFLSLLMLPIGIFYCQPMINRIYKSL